jgi:hypothetical protein
MKLEAEFSQHRIASRDESTWDRKINKLVDIKKE